MPTRTQILSCAVPTIKAIARKCGGHGVRPACDCRNAVPAPLPTLQADSWPLSRPQALFLEPLVEIGNIFAVAVEQERRLALAGADEFLGRLAPARMRDLRIDVGPEAVFGRLQRLPVALRPLVGEVEPHDRF